MRASGPRCAALGNLLVRRETAEGERENSEISNSSFRFRGELMRTEREEEHQQNRLQPRDERPHIFLNPVVLLSIFSLHSSFTINSGVSAGGKSSLASPRTRRNPPEGGL